MPLAPPYTEVVSLALSASIICYNMKCLNVIIIKYNPSKP